MSMTCDLSAQHVENHERVRAYEIAAYLTAASFPREIAHGPPANPVPSRDLTLNALVQHGVHRMDCDRAFLSLIDTRNQFICAEMTKHQSLAQPDPAQPLLLGVASIALEWGVCPYTMSIFHGKKVDLPDTPYIVADPSYFYIKDFRKVPTFATRPYVAGYPGMVSYVEVPLRSLSGHILGSYCVVDNRSRDFLRPESLATIREVTSSISSYLNMKRADAGRVRSERMVEGLRQFIGSERHIPPRRTDETGKLATGPFALDVFSQTRQTGYILCGGQNVGSDGALDSSGTPQSVASTAPSLNVSIATPISSAAITTSIHDSTSVSVESKPSSAMAHQETTSMPNMSDLANQISDLFVKAAALIGHAMDLDGLSFYDAVSSGTQYMSGDVRSSSADDTPSQHVPREEETSAKSLSEFRTLDTTESMSARQPKQSLIKRLTAAYPQGRVFAIDEYGVLNYDANHEFVDASPALESDSAHDEWEELFQTIPQARYVIFLPLWHYQRETCYATCIAWVTSVGKTLDLGDVNSLTAFGNSVMAEVFRVEAVTNTQSKSDFISSISHELRSPLHGILATVDLMQEYVEDQEIITMVDMIESCSTTLLDTFDHLLNFTKINSRTNGDEHNENNGSQDDRKTHNTTKVPADLGDLVEDVIATVSLGHLSATEMKSGLDREQRIATADRAKETRSQPVIVTTHIQNNCSWNIPLEKGAWKRILLNLCSNSLKYTEAGYIHVDLKLVEDTYGGSPSINLSVIDTGIGMHPEFLKYHLFTPFMQENNLTPGTGLGLSLVKSIVESIQGKITVESYLHKGTRVTVNVPLDQNYGLPVRLSTDHAPTTYGKLRGLSLGLLSIASGLDTDPSPRVVFMPDELQRSIRNICEGKLGMDITEFSADTMPKTDLVLVDTHALALTDIVKIKTLFSKGKLRPATSAVLTLGVPIAELNNLFSTATPTTISSPITSKRLATALLAALTTAQTFTSTTSIETPPQPTKDNLADLPTRSKPTRPLLPRAVSHDIIPPTPCRFKRFLLVDDNPINLKVLSAFATRIRIPYVLAHDGAEAVQLYTAALGTPQPFDCIFMDISMPVMDGFQAVTAIRKVEDETLVDGQGKSYILALTGLGSEAARTSAQKSGFDGFLVKPVRFKDVLPLLGLGLRRGSG